MKYVSKILAVAIGVFFLCGLAHAAAPDPTYSLTNLQSGKKRMFRLEITWTADDTDASIANVTIFKTDSDQGDLLTLLKGAFITNVITDPGTTAPTDNYDIVINDEYSYDVMHGQLTNRDTATSEGIKDQFIPIHGQFTAVFTNNSVNSATGKLILIIVW